VVAERIDAATPELGGEALAVPVRQQAHHDDRLLEPGGKPFAGRTTTAMSQRLDATLGMTSSPTVQAGPAGAEHEGRCDTLFGRGPHTANPEAQCREVLSCRSARWSSASGGEEQEPRAFLIRVTEWATMRVGACARHVATLRTRLNPMFH
jgi:hypothetical protein